MCLHKITHSHKIPMSVISVIGHSTTFIGIRDEGGLVWPIIYVVCVCGIVIENFQLLLSNENLCKSFIENSASARSGLMATKYICDDTIKNMCIDS